MSEPDNERVSSNSSSFSKVSGEEVDYISNEEVESRVRQARGLQTVHLLQGAHICLSGIFCLSLFWDLWHVYKTTGSLVCAILSTVSVFLMFLLTTMWASKNIQRLKFYESVFAWADDLTASGVCKSYAFRVKDRFYGSRIKLQLRKRPPGGTIFFENIWDLDPHTMALRWIRDYTLAAGDNFSFKRLSIITLVSIYLLFYPLIGFYASLIGWGWKIFQRMQPPEFVISEALV